MTTFIKKDGQVSVEASNDIGYYEIIEVRGKDTHPMDDLDYTRTVHSNQQIERMVESLSSEFGKDKHDNDKK